MPASIIIDRAGVMLNVSGSKRLIAVEAPSPGSTPVSVPNNTPRKQSRRFVGSKAIPNANATLSRMDNAALS
jgi:hypothetical protein